MGRSERVGIVSSGLAIAIVGLAACSSRGASVGAGSPDGNSGTGGNPGTGGSVGTDGGQASIDAPGGAPDATASPLTGTHAYVVQATFRFAADAGASSAAAYAPSSVPFTLVLDADRLTALAGSTSGLNQASVATSDGRTFRIDQQLLFGSTCTTSHSLNNITFTVDDDGRLSGVADGRFTHAVTDILELADATVSLAGVPDVEPPSLVGPLIGTPTDPFSFFNLIASEPLPAGHNPALISASGDVTMLPALATGLSAVDWTFHMPTTLLRYDETYRVNVDGIVDFAGNAADPTAAPTFTTRALPPLIPEDGFESATGTTLGGGQILTGPGTPVIAGAKSFYVPGTTAQISTTQQLALRLSASPGDTALRFSYRLVHPTGGPASIGLVRPVYILFGSVGGSVTTSALPPDTTPRTAASMLDGSLVYLGPTLTADIPLPPSVTDELVVDLRIVVGPCEGLPIETPGLILDDLRVE